MTSRRALFLGVGAAAAGVLLGSSTRVRAETAGGAGEVEWPVVVIGSGLAGLSAGAGALEAGAKRVLILEKGPLAGGHSLYSSGSIAAVDPERTGRLPNGWRDSIEQFVADALAVSGGTGNPEMLAQIAFGSADALKWLEGMGVSFGRPFVARSGLSPRSWAMRGNSAGRSYVLAVMAHFRRLGGTVRFNARVRGLERMGAATGSAGAAGLWRVLVEEAGRMSEVRARAVVIASGGFTTNVARRMRINPLLTADVRTSANPYGSFWDGADGDALDWAKALGAGVTQGNGLQLLPFWGGRLLDYAGGDIYVDMAGRRFVDENLPWNAIADKMLKLEERSCWVITDSQSYKGATLGLKLINGIVQKSMTIAEMAAGMGVEQSVLEAELKAYNAAAAKGFDPKTGKRIFTQLINLPPYYWGKEYIYVHTTLDGILTDLEGRVLSAAGDPMPGLYAAGEVAGGIFGTDRMGGTGMTNCLVMGRAAGDAAARRGRF